MTASGQARAVRGEAKTPEYEIDEEGLVPNDWDRVPLLSPNPERPTLSRTSSNGSTSSRGVLRRIFIDRPTTPSQHLSRPTFPPPSSSTYSPLPPSSLSLLDMVNLFINQTISILLSTVFLAFVVTWAISMELIKGLPKWIRGNKAKVFPWDNDRYWRKEGRKISKDPKDYAQQVGMDIEHQRVETEDGYYLKWVMNWLRLIAGCIA
jgi:lysosomal acid lipase/cholesteryl ester hydrolase